MQAERFLILDDDAGIGQVILALAESFGVQARFTTCPREFFRVCEDWHPTHVALDLVMPELDGVQVLAELARRDSAARIIITSGVGGRVLEAARRTAGEHGLHVVGVLSKPFRAATLRALLFESQTGVFPMLRASAFADVAGPTEDELRAAIDAGDIGVVFQPKVRCTDGALAGFEALARWQHGDVAIPPDHFIPLAERAGLIDALGDHVMREALAWFAAAFPDPAVSLSVNLSARSLAGRDLAERIHEQCRDVGVAPERLVLELTESSAMEDPVKSLELLTRLRVRGLQLSIDDFGTGYSSMVQLVRLPFSELKVDKSFVKESVQSAEARAVVRSVIDLGRSLGLRTTAEGVEDHSTLQLLRGAGCDLVQGFHVARPMPGDAAVEWARAWRGLGA